MGRRSASGLIALYNGTFTDSGEESAQVRSAPVSALPLLQTPAHYSELLHPLYPSCKPLQCTVRSALLLRVALYPSKLVWHSTPPANSCVQTPAPYTKLRSAPASHTPSHHSEVLRVLHPTCNLLHTTVRLALLLRANAYHTPPPPLLQGSEHACTLYTTPAPEGTLLHTVHRAQPCKLCSSPAHCFEAVHTALLHKNCATFLHSPVHCSDASNS